MLLKWLLGWWIILPYNICVMLLTALFPPFDKWYRYSWCTYCCGKRFQQLQTYQRWYWNIFKIPCSHFALEVLIEVAFVLAFTLLPMAPFRDAPNTLYLREGWARPVFSLDEFFESVFRSDFNIAVFLFLVTFAISGACAHTRRRPKPFQCTTDAHAH